MSDEASPLIVVAEVAVIDILDSDLSTGGLLLVATDVDNACAVMLLLPAVHVTTTSSSSSSRSNGDFSA